MKSMMYISIVLISLSFFSQKLYAQETLISNHENLHAYKGAAIFENNSENHQLIINTGKEINSDKNLNKDSISKNDKHNLKSKKISFARKEIRKISYQTIKKIEKNYTSLVKNNPINKASFFSSTEKQINLIVLPSPNNKISNGYILNFNFRFEFSISETEVIFSNDEQYTHQLENSFYVRPPPTI